MGGGGGGAGGGLVASEEEVTAISSGFLVLRLLNPLLLSPLAPRGRGLGGLLPAGAPVSRAGRRSLMAVAKVLQTLGNGARFGAKVPNPPRHGHCTPLAGRRCLTSLLCARLEKERGACSPVATSP